MFDLLKDYKSEIEFFYKKLQSNEKFALCKFADGEEWAIKGRYGFPGLGEWVSNADDPIYEIVRAELLQALQYKDSNYYVAICPCYKNLIDLSGQNQSQITYANIFVNSNYKFYTENYINLYKERDIHLVTHYNADLDSLPFKVEKFYPVDYNAWVVNRDLPEKILQKDLKDKLFLFSTGSFGNILAHKLWSNNKNNTYLDVGSTLNKWTKIERLKRGYYMGDKEYENFTCPCPTFSNQFAS